jgi:small-conductance mechanosensitive channel
MLDLLVKAPYFKEITYTLIILITTLLISRIVKRYIIKFFYLLPEDVRKVIASSVGSIIYLFSVFAILNVWGLDLGSIILSLGAFSIAVSFALRNTLENLVSGILLMIDKPFKIGDEIEVKGIRGKVEKIAIRYTIVSTEDHKVFIPSKILLNEPLKNYSAN